MTTCAPASDLRGRDGADLRELPAWPSSAAFKDGSAEWIGTDIESSALRSDDYTVVMYNHRGWGEEVEIIAPATLSHRAHGQRRASSGTAITYVDPQPALVHLLALATQRPDRRVVTVIRCIDAIAVTPRRAASRQRKEPIGRPIGPGSKLPFTTCEDCVRTAYCTFTATSSMTNEVAREEFSMPVNFRVTVLPM